MGRRGAPDGDGLRRILGAMFVAALIVGCSGANLGTGTSTAGARPSPTPTPSPTAEPSPSETPSAPPTATLPSPSPTPSPEPTPWSAGDPCPVIPVDLATVRDVARAGRAIECFGRRALTFRAYVPVTEGLGGTSGSKMTPRWIADPWTGVLLQPGPLPQQDQDAWLIVRVPPTLGSCDITYVQSPRCPFGAHLDGYLTVTGHFDEPVAATCRSRPFQAGGDPGPSKARMIARCRREFVVSAIAPAS